LIGHSSTTATPIDNDKMIEGWKFKNKFK
jgi:hypothetical protein